MTSTARHEPQPLRGCGALVTGGSRGIGRATARRLAADGAAVALTHHEHANEARSLVAEITADGGRAFPVPLDVADQDGFAAAYDAIDDAFAQAGVGLDVLVANAGVFTTDPIADVPIAEWDRVMGTNARGTLLTLQHAIPRLRDDGRIITLSTIGTRWPSPGEAVYAASKAAVEQLTRVCSRELGHRGITANTVSAGPTDTDLLRASAPQESLDGAAAMTALGRLGRPADLADLVALLARADSHWITGQNIAADGGLC